jgi:hypothetical protein
MRAIIQPTLLIILLTSLSLLACENGSENIDNNDEDIDIMASDSAPLFQEDEIDCEVGDGDEDGIGYLCDNCPDISNPSQKDNDTDGFGDACDDNDDADDTVDTDDNCPDRTNEDQLDIDEDGVGDVCDNCPDVANEDQSDIDEDDLGDSCDDVDDREEIEDEITDEEDDVYEDTSSESETDESTETIVSDEICDDDIDNDNNGYVDCSDSACTKSYAYCDSDHDGIYNVYDQDKDNDGLENNLDICPYTANSWMVVPTFWTTGEDSNWIDDTDSTYNDLEEMLQECSAMLSSKDGIEDAVCKFSETGMTDEIKKSDITLSYNFDSTFYYHGHLYDISDLYDTYKGTNTRNNYLENMFRGVLQIDVDEEDCDPQYSVSKNIFVTNPDFESKKVMVGNPTIP